MVFYFVLFVSPCVFVHGQSFTVNGPATLWTKRFSLLIPLYVSLLHFLCCMCCLFIVWCSTYTRPARMLHGFYKLLLLFAVVHLQRECNLRKPYHSALTMPSLSVLTLPRPVCFYLSLGGGVALTSAASSCGFTEARCECLVHFPVELIIFIHYIKLFEFISLSMPSFWWRAAQTLHIWSPHISVFCSDVRLYF